MTYTEQFQQSLIELCTGNSNEFDSREVAQHKNLPQTEEVLLDIPSELKHRNPSWFTDVATRYDGNDPLWHLLRPRHMP
jgi:hypothetical protein